MEEEFLTTKNLQIVKAYVKEYPTIRTIVGHNSNLIREKFQSDASNIIAQPACFHHWIKKNGAKG